MVWCLKRERTEFGKNIRKAYETHQIQISRHQFLRTTIRSDGLSNTISTVQKDNYILLNHT